MSQRPDWNLQFQIKEDNKLTQYPSLNWKLKKGVLIAAIIRDGKAIFQMEMTVW